MNKSRLEAFSDGVIAIIITIMVLNFKVPESTDYEAIMPLLHKFISYILSFIYIGICWSNHHHMMHTVRHVNGKVLWANLHLLFWMSLIPFSTAWIGEHHFAPFPMMFYGIILFLCGFAYYLLQMQIIKIQGKDSPLLKAIGNRRKEKATVVLLITAITLSYFHTVTAGIIYIVAALMWLAPDKRIERIFTNQNE